MIRSVSRVWRMLRSDGLETATVMAGGRDVEHATGDIRRLALAEGHSDHFEAPFGTTPCNSNAARRWLAKLRLELHDTTTGRGEPCMVRRGDARDLAAVDPIVSTP